MTLIGQMIRRAIKLGTRFPKLQPISPLKQQQKVLRRLLRSAAYTKFGYHYRFTNILGSENLIKSFQDQVPYFNYNSMLEGWWKKTLDGEENVSWPGRTKYFGLSSGTSESASKRIPLTKEMIRAIKRASIKQIVSSKNYDLPSYIYEKKILMLGGSTSLNNRGDYFEGDMSGISAKQIPFWFHVFYKPGRKIAKEKNWEKKLNDIAKKAKDWDVSIIVGVPAWIQILLERIIEHYDLENIHELWPHLEVYVHSGVSFDPYREGFKKLLGRPILTQNTYLASEGFIAFDSRPNSKGMRMLLTNGIYYEFVPFDENNFDADGEILPQAKALHIGEVEEGKQYAILLSTCAGAWRYVIGDVIQFTDKENLEIIISGRTKHYISLTGEHLSVDNMNHAIQKVAGELNLDIREFTVAGIPYEGMFAHHWWIGSDTKVDVTAIRDLLDKTLRELNDDYAIERDSALKDLFVTILPNKTFIDWLESKGKLGGQHKFPRVMKGKQIEDWEKFISSYK